MDLCTEASIYWDGAPLLYSELRRGISEFRNFGKNRSRSVLRQIDLTQSSDLKLLSTQVEKHPTADLLSQKDSKL